MEILIQIIITEPVAEIIIEDKIYYNNEIVYTKPFHS